MLGHSVSVPMVGQQILDLLIVVRIPGGNQITARTPIANFSEPFLDWTQSDLQRDACGKAPNSAT